MESVQRADMDGKGLKGTREHRLKQLDKVDPVEQQTSRLGFAPSGLLRSSGALGCYH